MKRAACVVFMLALLITAGQAAFATAAVAFTSPAFDFSNFTDLVGWQFAVNNSITVDALGFYDNPANGIHLSHPVGIYDTATQSLVLSGTVGPSDPYSAWFNWASVTPTVLLAGHTYDIVTVLYGENRTWNPNGISFDPNITYIQSEYSNGVSTLSFPCCTDGLLGHFGPNFDIQTSSPVPEPSMLVLFGTGLAGLLNVTRRKIAK
jgi:hypothetical protein